MDCQVVDGTISIEYKEGVKNLKNIALLVEGYAHCPCNRCVNREIHYRDTLIAYLYTSGFMQNYKHWYAHGETWETITLGRMRQQHRNVDRMVDMVMDAAGPKFD